MGEPGMAATIRHLHKRIKELEEQVAQLEERIMVLMVDGHEFEDANPGIESGWCKCGKVWGDHDGRRG